MAEENKDYVWRDRKRPIFGLPLSFTVYTLTEDRLLLNTGFLNTKEDEVRLYRIKDVSLSRSLFQRMFGVGTIQISSFDKTLGNFEIKDVKNSREVKEMLSELIEKSRDKKHVVSREFMADDDVDDDQ